MKCNPLRCGANYVEFHRIPNSLQLLLLFFCGGSKITGILKIHSFSKVFLSPSSLHFVATLNEILAMSLMLINASTLCVWVCVCVFVTKLQIHLKMWLRINVFILWKMAIEISNNEYCVQMKWMERWTDLLLLFACRKWPMEMFGWEKNIATDKIVRSICQIFLGFSVYLFAENARQIRQLDKIPSSNISVILHVCWLIILLKTFTQWGVENRLESVANSKTFGARQR